MNENKKIALPKVYILLSYLFIAVTISWLDLVKLVTEGNGKPDI